MNPLNNLLVLLGLVRDPTADTVEARVTEAFRNKLVVFSPPKTRVITIQFTSTDADLAARTANLVAELYIQEQSAAKRAMAKDAAESLAAQIVDLRTKLASADAERESYRLQTGLLSGSNNMTITGQQLADINSDLSKARSIQADAQAKASMIRDLLRSGKAADVPEVINNDIVRRIWDQRSTAQATLALESRTLLPGHPRIKALQAQVAAYDLDLKSAAKQAASSLENEAKIAGARVDNLQTVLTQQKKLAGASNVDEVHLRALERTTQSYKDQLESSTAKYQEALARQSSEATPADARIITRATPPEEPSFPKKLPFLIFGTVATFFLAVGFVIASELLSGRAAADASLPETGVAPREPVHVPRRERVRMPDMLQKLSPDPVDEPDLAFAPLHEAPARSPNHRRSVRNVLASTLAYVRSFGLSAAQSRVRGQRPQLGEDARAPVSGVGWDRDDETARSPSPQADLNVVDFPLVDQIVSAHVPGRGLHIVGTCLGGETGATATLITLSRALADKGRSVIVDLNRTPMQLVALCEGERDARAKIMTMSGLSELLAGDASFAEVIYRDHGSRLHFIPSGRQEADFRDFDLILDALSETYDFVMLLAPAFPQSEVAKVMAPYADFIVLSSTGETDERMLAMTKDELIDAGAREILVAGAKSAVHRDADVA